MSKLHKIELLSTITDTIKFLSLRNSSKARITFISFYSKILGFFSMIAEKKKKKCHFIVSFTIAHSRIDY